MFKHLLCRVVDSLFVLLVDVGTFTQQQLRHLLPLGVWRSHRTVLEHTATLD